MPARIGEAGNTQYGISLRLLAHRGFTVVFGPDVKQEQDYWAIHPDGTALIGSTPLILVGLLSILDHLGEDWYRSPRLPLDDPGKIVDLTPEALETLPEAQRARAREALRLLGAIRQRDVAGGSTGAELAAAARAWVEESRQIEEFNLSDAAVDE